MFGKIKKTKGITLISLIITIIIMLILAGIAISFIIGNNGLFKKAKISIEIHKKASVQEELQLAVDNGYAEEKTNKLKVAEDMEKDCPGIEWEYKSSLAGHYKGYNFTVINEEVVMDIIQDNTNTIINSYYDKLYFWNETYNNSIKNITFKIDNLSNYNTNAVLNENNEYKPWDVSQKRDSSIIAYFEKITENSYTLHIISDKIIDLPEDASHFFSNPSIETINGFNNISTANTIDINYMFGDCTNLKELNLVTNFDTSNVTNMEGMFFNCSDLTSLDLSNFNTSKVTNMNSMFLGCNKITSLNLENNFNTSNVINMSHMFENCNCLQNLNLGSKFDTSKVTDMSYMFDSCSSLTELNLGDKFNTSNVIYMQHMFHYCRSLTSLDLSKFDTSKVTDMRCMFAECNNMHSLILGSQFSISNCEIKLSEEEATTQHSYDNMFDNFAIYTNTCTIKCTQNVQKTITDNNLITNTNVVTFKIF